MALLDLMLTADELARGALVQPFGPVLPGYRCFLVYPEAIVETERIAADQRFVQRKPRPLWS